MFSTSTDFQPEKPYTKLGAYAVLHGFGDDYRAAADQLRAEGYGAREPKAAKAPTGEAKAAPGADGADVPARRLVLTAASDIEPEPVVWAWEDDGYGRVPAGSLGLFAGREGTGKSSFLIWLTARITTGTLPGMFFGKARAVIYVAVEDSWKYTIAPRLIAAGADLTLVYRAEVRTVDDGIVSLSLPAHNELLEEAIVSYQVAMVALDPLMSAISGSLDTHVNREVRQALDPLAQLADRTGAIVAGIAHFSKARGSDASSLITGSGRLQGRGPVHLRLRYRPGRHPGHYPDQEQPRPGQPAFVRIPDHRGSR